MTHSQNRLRALFEWGGWEIHTPGGAVLFIIADGVDLEADPRVFRSVRRSPERLEEFWVASIAARDAARLFSTEERGPYERPPSTSEPWIVRDPIPRWRVQLTDGTSLEIAADTYRTIGEWCEFTFGVDDGSRGWDEPVLFVRSKWFSSATVLTT
ncbi:hypothetical protein IT072_07750 [Leifsonia sp. ZF2019]|uniref:hypothetical protein n=1 Tax=Leifsonia sp. ZF2019 TaxID=2781978 RepID=UPI001CC0AC78|nr:hypothetical protein [Leifsonia sp. ZF2019]UAJ80889.1 hypothetical protein IT072_07750 [Leifsonia sp. ZF2019]